MTALEAVQIERDFWDAKPPLALDDSERRYLLLLGAHLEKLSRAQPDAEIGDPARSFLERLRRQVTQETLS